MDGGIQERYQQFPLELDRPLFLWRYLPYPPPDELSRTLWGVYPWDDVLIFETTANEFGFLDREGLVRPLTDILGEGLRESLADRSLVWASPAEPSSSLRLADAPDAVAILPDGTGIAERVSASPDGLLGQDDKVRVTTAFAPAMTATATTPCQDFLPVYASSRGWVFLVGARAEDGAPRGIRRIDAETGASVDLHAPIALGNILAATFDPLLRELVILDEPEGELPARARLLRISVATGGARVVDSWRRHHRYDDYSLHFDGTGRILLAASDRHPRRHRVLDLVETGGAIRARKVAGGNTRLATRPWSNELSLFLATEDRAGNVSLDKVPLVDAGGDEDPESVL